MHDIVMLCRRVVAYRDRLNRLVIDTELIQEIARSVGIEVSMTNQEAIDRLNVVKTIHEMELKSLPPQIQDHSHCKAKIEAIAKGIDALQSEIERQTTGGWIPVSEIMPTEATGRILMWDGYMYFGRYSEFSKTWYKGDMCAVGGRPVTHWMPLPNPPKEDK